MEIFSLVSSSWVGIFEIFIMGISGFILVKKKILPSDTTKILSRLIMDLTLPFLIFTKIVTQFDFEKFNFWWILPFVAMSMIFFGFLLGNLFSGGIKKNIRREFVSLCGYQNSGYLILALIGAMFKTEIADVLFIYTFLFLAGFNFLIWSVGTFYLRKGVGDIKLRVDSFFTPPFIAIVISLGCVAVGINKQIPDIILNPLSQIGASTVPLGIIAIGAILGEIKFNLKYEIRSLFRIVTIKLILLPLFTVFILSFVNLSKWMEFFIFLESLMPSATSLGIIARRYHADYHYIANAVLVTHLFSLVSIPLFIAFYYKLFI